ncbi:MAG: IMP dehydrogenase [Acholeplasmatales bacterium]|nr:MAG: IMP dehydrogenase [Acholeplasmatales bacterium]
MSEKIVQKGYTFDDLLLIPAHSNVLPKAVSLHTRLCRDITLALPIVSSAMDTVTESRMAIAMARLGGLGFLHKNMSIALQTDAVHRVKKSESGMITDPVTLRADQTLADAEALMAHYKISGFPVIEEGGRLIGILTNRDVRYRDHLNYTVGSTMTQKGLITAPVGTSLLEAKQILLESRIEKLPIVDQHGVLQGLITIKDIDKARRYPDATKDAQGRLRCGAAVGVGPDTLKRVASLVEAHVDVIAVDSAHGHSEGVIETVRQLRTHHPKLAIIAGNIVTAAAAEALIQAGADALKVGVGPGSICTTRVIAGVGVPQLTAIMNVAAVAEKHGIPVIGDGGIKYSGDIAKALAAGADCVMLGGLLAGCEESPGEEIIFNNRRYKVYQGMGSISAMRRGSSDRYFQGDTSNLKKLVPEGIEARVPFKGKVEDVLFQLAGGLRSSMGYCGAVDIPALQKDGRFVAITPAGQKESHPHSVELTQESPNYHRESQH